MDPSALMPLPDPIPAAAGLFLVLDNLLFLLHLLLVNLVVGGCLIMLFSRAALDRSDSSYDAAVLQGKIPLVVPFAITLGVAPLLFVQVIYGHLFYTSSALMAAYWIGIIPMLILAYYGTYFHARHRDRSPQLARLVLGLATVLFLGIAFAYVNNMTLMIQPERWMAYFHNRRGTLLNLADPTLIPRYLHFLLASIAVAALVMAALWARRELPAAGEGGSPVKHCLRLFAAATAVQIGVGLWFTLVLPTPVRSLFYGQDPVAGLILLIGALSGVGAMVSALRGRLRPTLVQLGISLVFMVVTRSNLRSFYLRRHFALDQLRVVPQYGVLVLFLVVLVTGLIIVGYMFRLAFAKGDEGEAT
jgi:hypothetical protein